MRLYYKWLLAVPTIALAVILYWILSPSEISPIVINEVCSNNFSLIKDETGQYTDYVELYNASDETVSLEGFFLSDDGNRLAKYPLEAVVIPPGGYYVVWLDGKDDISVGRTGFKLSRLGEELFLSDEEGAILDFVTIPELSYNTVYGREEDGKGEWGIMSATTGDANLKAEKKPFEVLPEPVFSAESGFYEEPFKLCLTAPEGEDIYYTLDGSEPTPESFLYQAPLAIQDASGEENVYAARTDLSPTRSYVPPFKVDKATVVRAVSWDKKRNRASKVVSKVYFVGYQQRDEYKDMPVVSLVTDPSDLFDEESGIYGNGKALESYKAEGGLVDGELLDSFTDKGGVEHYLYAASNAFGEGKEWEREASFTYFDEAHGYCFSQNVGIRIAGQSTRATPQKSFNINGRDIYDDETLLPYEFFEGTSYSAFKLRNGGNNNDGVMITDAFLEKLAQGRAVSTQGSRPCILFLNGEYWGIYNIRERYKEEYVRNHFGVSEGNVWMIDAGTARVGDSEAQEAYEHMLAEVEECDLSFDDVYAMISEIIDIQSLIDYCCINLYVNNTDVSFSTNTALWRTIEPEETGYGDGRWRWMLFDLDVTLRQDEEEDLTWMEENALLNEPMIRSLMENEQFRKQFCLTFMDIANTNYAYDRVHEELMKWAEIYRTQVVKNHRRFFETDFPEEKFDGYIAEIDDFFRDRFLFAMKSLAAEFDLEGTLETITVKNSLPDGGTVMVNTAEIEEEEWNGQYYTDHPVTFTARAKEGYRFAGWRGDVSGSQEQKEAYIPVGGLRVEAVFEKEE